MKEGNRISNTTNQKVDTCLHNIYNALPVLEKPSLFTGNMGLAMFYAYYYKYTKDFKVYKKFSQSIENSISYIEKESVGYSFSHGLSGIGWAISHFNKLKLLDGYSEEFLSGFDEIIAECSLSDLRTGNFDYLHAGLGGCLFFLERPKSQKRMQYFEVVFDIIYSLRIEEGDGCYWDFDFFNKSQDNYLNLGLAHGIPSVILLLCRLYNIGVKKSIVKGVILKACNWLLRQKDVAKEVFPSHLVNGKPGKTSRLAWCYGNLGVAYALFKASEAINENILFLEALKIFSSTAKRTDFIKERISDANICHGSIGVALFYKKMYLDVSNQEYEEVYKYWRDVTLKYAKYNDVGSGFKTNHNNNYYEDYGLLEGIVGVGLGLLTLKADKYFKWQGSILL
ncbi:MAG: lanthionine synthetase C family protein [Salinivirgaceae bacterium]|nr:lanthionine synthetase C family protein [Salinivirgaceae bacterium]